VCHVLLPLSLPTASSVPMRPDVNCARWDSTLLVMELVSPVLRVAPSAKALQYAVFATKDSI